MAGVQVLSSPDVRVTEFTADELGLTDTLVGEGEVVTLVERLPVGWGVRSVAVRRLGNITSASGTVVLNIGTLGDTDHDNIVDALDLEGSGSEYLSPTVVRYDNDGSEPVEIVAQVVTATAAPTAVAGLRIEVELVKIGREN